MNGLPAAQASPCRHRADDQPADQPGPGRGRDAVEIAEADAGFGQRAARSVVDMVEMRPRRDLRHDPAIGRMLGELRADQIGADLRPPAGRRPPPAAVSSQLVSMPRTIIPSAKMAPVRMLRNLRHPA